MSNLREYYADLLRWEEQQYRQLIHAWPEDLRDAIVVTFVNAVSDSLIKGSVCSIRPDSTNQSIGNQVAKYTVVRLNTVILQFSILHCSGAGYPDKVLLRQDTSCRIPLELKATSEWNPKDANRRVLTSSSEKLRKQFSEPIHHLLLTVFYTQNQNSATIDTIRLDFLEPTTTVNVRFEASVNHKILADENHYSEMI